MRSVLRSVFIVSVVSGALTVGCSATGEQAESTTTTTTASSPSTSTTTRSTTTIADEAPTTTSSSGSEAEACAAFQRIRDYDEMAADVVNGSASWTEQQELFVGGADDVLSAYDDAIDATDGTVKEDLQTLRDYTEPTADFARESSSLAEFSEKLSSAPGLQAAGQAGLRLDAYSRKTCGFGTSTMGD